MDNWANSDSACYYSAWFNRDDTPLFLQRRPRRIRSSRYERPVNKNFSVGVQHVLPAIVGLAR